MCASPPPSEVGALILFFDDFVQIKQDTVALTASTLDHTLTDPAEVTSGQTQERTTLTFLLQTQGAFTPYRLDQTFGFSV